MAAQVVVNVKRIILPLVGVKGLDVVIDGQVVATTMFGESATVEVAPGGHRVELTLRSVISRTSNPIDVNLADGQTVNITAKYSRMLGTFNLKLG